MAGLDATPNYDALASPENDAFASMTLVANSARVMRAHRVFGPVRGISAVDLSIISAVIEAPGLSVKEIAAREDIVIQTISPRVARLDEKGLLHKYKDRNATSISITRKGEQAYHSFANQYLPTLVEALKFLSEADRSKLGSFSDAIDHMLRADGDWNEEGGFNATELATALFLMSGRIVRACRSAKYTDTQAVTILDYVQRVGIGSSEDLFTGETMAKGNHSRIARGLVDRGYLTGSKSIQNLSAAYFELSESGERLFSEMPAEEVLPIFDGLRKIHPTGRATVSQGLNLFRETASRSLHAINNMIVKEHTKMRKKASKKHLQVSAPD